MKFGNENCMEGKNGVKATASDEVKAVVFDMDGILLDSESICDRTWEVAAKEWKLKDADKAIQDCRGRNKTDSILVLKKYYGQDFDGQLFLQRTSDLFYEIEKKEGIPLMHYAKEILEYLKSKGYRIALASSTRGESVKRQLTNAGLIHYFETLTTGDMVKHSKPDPEIYQMACASLGLRCDQCVAVEDSPNGVKSAALAGLKVVMVPDKIQPDEEMKQLTWQICDSLEGLCKKL